jgi:hypothetical protein
MASRRCETQGLRKVESSTLKKCGEEKARKVLHPKCKSEKRKVSSLHPLHFIFLCGFFFLCVFFFSFYLRRKRWQRESA